MALMLNCNSFGVAVFIVIIDFMTLISTRPFSSNLHFINDKILENLLQILFGNI